MAAKETEEPINLHTEYSHSRSRCPSCGAVVPATARSGERRLCDGCMESE